MQLKLPNSDFLRRLGWLGLACLATACQGPEGGNPAASLVPPAGQAEPSPPVGQVNNTNQADASFTTIADSATASANPAAANPVDAKRAYGYLKQICDLGPRPTGSPAMLAQQELLTAHFTALGAKVDFQRFHMRHPRTGEATPVVNTIVQWHPDRAERILLCAHYDTRPQPDNQRVPARDRGTVFIGANDGGSGTALLMELGHHMPGFKNTNVGVDFVFFDAEEFVFNLGGKLDKYFVGSEHFARQYVSQPRSFKYRWGVLFDMVGDRKLEIYQERNSMWWRDTRPLVKDIWATAKKLGVREFIARKKHEVRDDHVPLRNIGKIPSCDIIDFDYPRHPRNAYWHTAADTIDKCSGESLAKVGWVALAWLEGLE